MKKAYTKPEIMFEDFSLSSSVATGCKFLANHAENVCAYELKMSSGTWNVFTGTITACTTNEGDLDNNADGTLITAQNTICYHVPAEYNLFTS